MIIHEQTNFSNNLSWHENITVENVKIKFKLDSGAESSVLPLKYFEKLNVPKIYIKPTLSITQSYGNFGLKVLGEINLTCQYRNKLRNIKFLIVDHETEPILGLKDCVNFNLIYRLHSIEADTLLSKNKKDLFNNFSDIFQGLGCMPGFVDIKLKPNAIPVIQTQRKVPLSLLNNLKSTLDDLESKNIISKVTYN